MPTMSFKKTVEDVKASETSGNAEILEITEETALVPSPKKELANLTNAAGDVIGEFDTKDIRLPYLRIVQKISDDASTFGSGSILFNGEVKLATEGNPIRMTFVQMQKFYEEKLPMQAEKRPLICDTAEEVLKAGGVLQHERRTLLRRGCHASRCVGAPRDNLRTGQPAIPVQSA